MIIICALLLISFTWYITNTCVFCKSVINEGDRTISGRVRWRKRGTQYPVCNSCGLNRRGEVD